MASLSVPKEASGKLGDFLSPAEVQAAMAGLLPADKLKLQVIERVRLRGTSFAPKALLREAISRVWLGKRHCPRHVPVMAFLIKTMQSIASHDRDRLQREAELHVDSGQDNSHAGETTFTPALEYEALEATRRSAKSAETVEEIQTLFAEDAEAQLVIIGWSLGLRGAELRDETGLDQAALDYAAKRIRQTMRKLYPKGYTNEC